MKVSKIGIDLIKEFEGCYLTAYRCPAGVWTIGFGHTGTVDGKQVCTGMKINQSKADELLIQSLDKRYEPAVRKFSWLNQNQYDALVSFCYNLGPGIFKGSLLESINKKDWNDVARQMKLYNKARVDGVLKELPGLTRRRNAEAELLLKECEQVKPIKISLNGKIKEVNAIEKDGHNYVMLQDLRDTKIEVSYDSKNKIPVIKSI